MLRALQGYACTASSIVLGFRRTKKRHGPAGEAEPWLTIVPELEVTMAESEVTPSASYPQPLTLDHELRELSDLILNLLFLSEGDVTETQLAQYSEQLTHVLRYARALGFHGCFLWEDGAIAIEWQPLGVAS